MSSLADLVVGVGDDRVVTASISGEVDLSNAAELTRSLVEAVPNEAAGLPARDEQRRLPSTAPASGCSPTSGGGSRGARRRSVIVAPEASRTRKVLSLTGAAGSFQVGEIHRGRARDDGRGTTAP